MTDLHFRPALELARLIRDREIGCAELLEHYLKRVERYNPKLNAIIAMDLPVAPRRAAEADAALTRGEIWGPLHGVPMTVKESYNVAGLPTTWGQPALKDNVPTTNALAVDRVLQAGVVIFGKTNVPLNLADWQSYNEVYGTTNNPWDLTRTPGGSSGGSAAALAAGLTGIETGSDIGSSIRNPAHYCGVYGHKPTWGIVPPRGHALPGSVAQGDISVVGPLARSAEDLSVALQAMAGPDDIDGAGLRLDLPRPQQQKLADYRIAVLVDHEIAPVDRAVADRIQGVADFLAKHGAKVDDRARPAIDMGEAWEVYVQLLRAATSGRMAADEFQRNIEEVRQLKPEDRSYRAEMMRANTMAHKDWLGFNNRRHQMRLAWAEFFKDWDLLLCPVAASAAFPHDHEGERWQRVITVNNTAQPTTTQLFWAGYSGAFYLPSTVAPAGLSPQGLPIGVQIVAPQYGDLVSIELARKLEHEMGGFVPPPGYGD
jgi:amidase